MLFTPLRILNPPLFLVIASLLLSGVVSAQTWSTKLDGRIRFYQSTELGVLVAGTEKSLYAVDGESGEVLWRRKNVKLDETDVAPIPGTDLLLLNLESGSRTRIEATDLLTGESLWRSDNYRPPVFLDNRLYLFYDGLTSQDSLSGKDRRSEKFRVNEEGLALTEADPVADEGRVYVSGRGKVRSISRASGEEVWEAKDLGSVPEMILTRNVLYVRTGGQFARLRDGDTVSRGPYGVSAIDLQKGKTLWRFKGADKGITNLVLADPSTLVVADRDDLIVIDAATGKRRAKVSHDIEAASFVLLNEKQEAVVGGKNEIAAFDLKSGRNTWRARHNPPGRGLLRTVAAVATRATALYFRYGSAATTAFRGVQLLNAVSSLRWSGLAAREALPSLTSLASTYGREYARDRIATYGVLARARQTASRGVPSMPRIPRPSVDIEERLLDRLDPAHQLDRLSRFFLRTRRLAAMRGDWMYFYTSLRGGNGLVGVNVNTGTRERTIRMSAPDERFVSDEAARLLYNSQDNRLLAYRLDQP